MGSFVITRKRTGATFKIEVKKRQSDKHSNLKRMKFDGDLVDTPIRFPDDVRSARQTLRMLGFDVGDRECQALYLRISRDYYPWRAEAPEGAWLTFGWMGDLIRQHAKDYLIEA